MASISYYVFQAQISTLASRWDWPTIRRNALASPLDHATRASWAALHARVVTNRYLDNHLNPSSLRSTTNEYVLSYLKATANGTLSILKATWTIVGPILTFTCKMLFEIMQLGHDRERARTDLTLHFSRFPKGRVHRDGSVDVVTEPTESEVSGLASTYSLRRREREKKEEREREEKAEREREANLERVYKMMSDDLERDQRKLLRNFEVCASQMAVFDRNMVPSRRTIAQIMQPRRVYVVRNAHEPFPPRRQHAREYAVRIAEAAHDYTILMEEMRTSHDLAMLKLDNQHKQKIKEFDLGHDLEEAEKDRQHQLRMRNLEPIHDFRLRSKYMPKHLLVDDKEFCEDG
ncbi:hypothetical protein LTR56_010930 [Elasticomyces elasticus]|nr:hypothetical protein LTR56_010930 [Elasticomyces elasticus]KAK3662629.1 hypothetical protein LTR22_006479 [Elasticomyces elasticus]KAK4926587.1 hypothetical protein LTR49_006521 [Elasticomyces elasticus]KAK5760680.1 hypothetical protein LTS12_009217 [Elasticomyces elasticus]